MNNKFVLNYMRISCRGSRSNFLVPKVSQIGQQMLTTYKFATIYRRVPQPIYLMQPKVALVRPLNWSVKATHSCAKVAIGHGDFTQSVRTADRNPFRQDGLDSWCASNFFFFCTELLFLIPSVFFFSTRENHTRAVLVKSNEDKAKTRYILNSGSTTRADTAVALKQASRSPRRATVTKRSHCGITWVLPPRGE